MGIYAEPGTSKLKWALANGTDMTGKSYKETPKGCLPVVVLAPFNGLGVAYSEREYKRLLTGVVIAVYAIPLEKLRQVTPGGITHVKSA